MCVATAIQPSRTLSLCCLFLLPLKLAGLLRILQWAEHGKGDMPDFQSQLVIDDMSFLITCPWTRPKPRAHRQATCGYLVDLLKARHGWDLVFRWFQAPRSSHPANSQTLWGQRQPSLQCPIWIPDPQIHAYSKPLFQITKLGWFIVQS